MNNAFVIQFQTDRVNNAVSAHCGGQYIDLLNLDLESCTNFTPSEWTTLCAFRSAVVRAGSDAKVTNSALNEVIHLGKQVLEMLSEGKPDGSRRDKSSLEKPMARFPIHYECASAIVSGIVVLSLSVTWLHQVSGLVGWAIFSIIGISFMINADSIATRIARGEAVQSHRTGGPSFGVLDRLENAPGQSVLAREGADPFVSTLIYGDATFDFGGGAAALVLNT